VHRYGIGVFSFHPGILPVRFATTAETWATPSTAQAKIASWTRQQRANGHGAETSQALAWILARVGGRGRRGR
jgi:hypothetical protein